MSAVDFVFDIRDGDGTVRLSHSLVHFSEELCEPLDTVGIANLFDDGAHE